MSTANAVRETRGLSGDDAWRTLAATGRLKLIWSALVRLRAADGFSHARSLAFALSLVLVQGVVALVGWAVAYGHSGFSHTIRESVRSTSPGPASSVLVWAVAQAQHVGREHSFLPLVVGMAGTIMTATTATGQIMRGVNRLYGIESDGPFLRKYGRAFLIAAAVLVAIVGAGGALTLGHHAVAQHGAHVLWAWIRWPLVVALASAAFGAILHFAPRRHQPRLSWLAFGGAVGVTGWILVTIALSLLFRVSSTFGEVYGPLAGVVALQLWTFGVAVATFFGAAIAAELEAVRSGVAASAASPR
jgi:uncharacterized BrkB/YihY/UPF0761 family membrane protein